MSVEGQMEKLGDHRVNGQAVYVANERFVEPGIYVWNPDTKTNDRLVAFDAAPPTKEPPA